MGKPKGSYQFLALQVKLRKLHPSYRTMVLWGTCWETWHWSRNDTFFGRWTWCKADGYQKERWNGHFVGCKGKYCRWIPVRGRGSSQRWMLLKQKVGYSRHTPKIFPRKILIKNPRSKTVKIFDFDAPKIKDFRVLRFFAAETWNQNKF